VYLICTDPPPRVSINRFSSGKAPSRKPAPIKSSPGGVPELHTVIYAGQSKALRRRFLEHRNSPNEAIESYVACYSTRIRFWFAEVAEAERLNRLEHFLIEAFNPPCNERGAPQGASFRGRLGAGQPIGSAKAASN